MNNTFHKSKIKITIKIIDNNDTDLLHNILTIINDIITVHI